MSLAGIVLAGFTVLIIVKIYLESDWRNLTCIISTVDGNKYCVREQAKMDKVADLLAHTTKDLKRLVQYANENILTATMSSVLSKVSTLKKYTRFYLQANTLHTVKIKVKNSHSVPQKKRKLTANLSTATPYYL